MKYEGLFAAKAIDEVVAEPIDFVEGCLLDSLIFYDESTEKYYMCLEHYLNCWSSCYAVYTEGGNGDELFRAWEEFKRKAEVA